MLNDYGKSLFKPWCSVQNVVLACSAVFFTGLVIRVYSPNSSEISSWVQAFGSIAAIIVAAWFPVLHSNRLIKELHKSLSEILRVISDDAAESLYLLVRIFHCPVRERKEMMRYETLHRGRDWHALVEQLSQIPVAELTPQLARDLSYLKDAVSFGSYVAAQIPDWMKLGGNSRPEVLRVLRAKRDLVGLIRSRLPVPDGISSPEVTQTQLVTQMLEMRRPSCEPIIFDDGEVYRRYFWKDNLLPLPDRVYIYGIYPYLNDFGPSLIEIPAALSDFQQVEEYVINYCCVLHGEHSEAEYLRLTAGAL